MGKRLVLHSHFSQPFRSNPTLGIIPQDPGLGTYLSRHHEALRECYGANSASRLLSSGGTVRELYNTFEYMSFSMDPVLMGWIEKNGPNVYGRILEADAASARRLGGFGNAIAAPYGHAILPLLHKDDAIAQIRWGMADFERRFGRTSKGFWLPECAISTTVIDVLIDLGVSFVVLGPDQGKATAFRGHGHWKDLQGHPLPDDAGYRVQGKHGELACFTYNEGLARSVVFDGFLKDGDRFYSAVLGAFEGQDLVSIATAGEIYGQGEAFGDMALTALIHRAQGERTFTFSNFAQLSEELPNDLLVKLEYGPDGRGSSWSCPHGLGQWTGDCSCTSASSLPPAQRKDFVGWIGKVRRSMVTLVTRGLRTLQIDDPIVLRNSYAEVVAGATDPPGFAQTRVSEDEVPLLLRYLESQRYMLMAFASFGWREPALNIAHLREALFLLPREEREQVRPIFNEGRTWFGDRFPSVSRDEKGLADMVPGAVFLLRYLHRREARDFGHHRFVDCTVRPETRGDGARGTVVSIDSRTTERREFPFVFRQDDQGVTLEMFDGDLWRNIPLEILPWESKRDVVRIVRANLEDEFFEELPALFEETKRVFELSRTLGVQPSPVISRAVELGANRVLEGLVPEAGTPMTPEDLERYEDTMDFCARYGVGMDQDRLYLRITRHIAALIDQFVATRSSETATYCLRILRLARAAGIHPDITIAQTLLFPMVRELRSKGAIAQKDEESYRLVSLLLELGREFLIDLDEALDSLLALR